MARVPVRSRGRSLRVVLLAALLGAVMPFPLHAANGKGPLPGSKAKQPTAAADEAPRADKPTKGKGDGAENPELLKSLAKVRPGSVLRRNKPLAEPLDLRGEFERRRDMELVRHYSRMAELDVIEAIARKTQDLRLLDRADEVRRKETMRFWTVMQELRSAARMRLLSGNP